MTPSPNISPPRKVTRRPIVVLVIAFVTLAVMILFAWFASLLIQNFFIAPAAPEGGSESITPPTDQVALPILNTPTPIPSPTETAPPTATFTPTPDPYLEELLSQMTVPELVGQTIMTGINGTEILPVMCDLIHQIQPGAVVYRTGNVIDPWQLQAFSSGLRVCAEQAGVRGGLLIAIDHEGQYVYRFESGATRFPMQMALGATGDLGLAHRVAQAAAQELRFSGVNMILGPNADIATNPVNPDVSTRSFGSDPESVASLTAIVVNGYLTQGILPTLKHFPGTGSAAVDPHIDLPIDESELAALDQHQLQPFRAGIGANAPTVMVSHVAFPSIDTLGRPSSLSPMMISEILKKELTFEGIVLTDALEMGAIIKGYGLTIEEAAVQSLAAGMDMVLIPSPYDAQRTFARILEAVETGELALERVKDAARRILRIKLAFDLQTEPSPVAVDWTSNAQLAEEVGRRAVSLVRDQEDLIPLFEDWQSLLVVCPAWYSAIPTTIRGSGRTVREVQYSLPIRQPVPEAGLLQSVPGMAGSYDGVIVCTYDAYLTQHLYNDSSQLEMVQGLVSQGTPTIVIALKSPFDLLGFPDAPTYLATFGTTSWQVQAAADVLVGTHSPGKTPSVDLGR